MNRDTATGALRFWNLCASFTSRERVLANQKEGRPSPDSAPPPIQSSNWLMRRSVSPNPLLSLNKYLLEICPPTGIYVMLDVVSFTDHTQGPHLSPEDQREEADADAGLKAGK